MTPTLADCAPLRVTLDNRSRSPPATQRGDPRHVAYEFGELGRPRPRRAELDTRRPHAADDRPRHRLLGPAGRPLAHLHLRRDARPASSPPAGSSTSSRTSPSAPTRSSTPTPSASRTPSPARARPGRPRTASLPACPRRLELAPHLLRPELPHLRRCRQAHRARPTTTATRPPTPGRAAT